jgi:hypothetical protein
MADFQDSPLATFATGDASYAWDWNWKRLDKPHGYYTIQDVQDGKVAVPAGWEPVKETVNDFALTKLPFAYLNRPLFELPHWIKPNGALSPIVKQPLYPVQKAFRTAGIVRGAHPYALVVDDIRKDNTVHHYDWTLHLEPDIQIASITRKSDSEMDILLTGTDPDQKGSYGKIGTALPPMMDAGASIPSGQPMLLVRVLHRGVDPSKPAADPQIVEMPNMTDAKKYGPTRRLLIPSDSVQPDYRVLLYPYRQGAPLPQTAWNADRTGITVAWPGQADTVRYIAKPDGSTRITVVAATY